MLPDNLPCITWELVTYELCLSKHLTASVWPFEVQPIPAMTAAICHGDSRCFGNKHHKSESLLGTWGWISYTQNSLNNNHCEVHKPLNKVLSVWVKFPISQAACKHKWIFYMLLGYEDWKNLHQSSSRRKWSSSVPYCSRNTAQASSNKTV